MMNLESFANLAEVISLVVVTGSIIFAIKQLQHYRMQREAKAAIELTHLLQNPEFIRALCKLLSCNLAQSQKKLDEHDVIYEESAMFISLTIESIGLMVHRRMVPINMVWELMGGLLVVSWQRLEPWVLQQRKLQASGKFSEWGQWLIEQMLKFENGNHYTPAYKRYVNWLPKN